MVITYDNRYAYSEIVEILGSLDIYYVEKLPVRLREFFTYNKLPDYIRHINMNEPLSTQNLSERTVTILAILNLRYWIENEDEKRQLMKKYQKEQEEYNEKYSSDNLFKKSSDSQDKVEEIQKVEEPIDEKLPVIIKKENIFKRFFSFIKNLLKK